MYSPSILYLEPNRTIVSPGNTFTVGISIQSYSARTVLFNFTFDSSKLEYVGGETFNIFDFVDTVLYSDNYIRYLGISGTPVNAQTKTEIAEITFKVMDTAERGDVRCSHSNRK